MKVCYFTGPEPRSQIISKGLRRNNVEVFETKISYKPRKILEKLFRKERFDVVIIGEYLHVFMPLAKLLKKIYLAGVLAFDPYISLYNTNVNDRLYVSESSWRGFYYFLLDKYSCEFADVCLLDTYENIKYFSSFFNINSNKFRRVFVGADNDIFYPQQVERKRDYFTVFWYGTYIPLHGAEYIVRAAKILEKYKDIQFTMVGCGQMYPQVKKLSESLEVSNIEFVKWIEYKQLPIYMVNADVCLGIFGNSDKARRVIPNKVFQALAVKKPVITANTPAVREALSHMEDAYLCDIASPKLIAEAILTLKEDETLRRKLAESGYQLFKKRFTVKQIGKSVKGTLEEALN